MSGEYRYEPKLTRDGQSYTDTRTGQQMRIESIDVLKGYLHSHRSLSVAVRVVDQEREPVTRARVRLAAMSPDGRISKFSESTDYNGIALFRVTDMGAGEWEMTITEVTHPCYTFGTHSSDEVRRAAFL
jgi:hypothetical protein